MNVAIPYRYVALDRTGAKRRGVAQAATEAEAFRQISAAGLTPVWIKEVRTRRGRRRHGVSTKDVANFTYQLATLMQARIPVSEGLRGIAEQEPPGQFRDVILKIVARVEAGGRIADALEEHEKIFGPLYIRTIRAAETSGNLTKVLEYLSEMLEKTLEMRQQLRGAMMYPMCVIVVLIIAVVFLLAFVVPRFAKMFAARSLELPIFTRILIAVGESFQNYWWVYLCVLVCAGLGLKAALRNPKGRAAIEKALHTIPYIRAILVGAATARFSRVLGLCLGSGLGLIDALGMAGKSSGRAMMDADAQKMVEQVRNGGRLSHVLAVCDYVPPFAKRMLSVGEESGELGRMCGVVARRYERDAASLAKNISTVIEPVLIVLIAAVVLLVALAIFLPMWDMVKLVG